jgi:hypothetical protein
VFGRKLSFGKKQHSLTEVQSMMVQPDSDGVRRIFSNELWDDPEIGDFLRKMGRNPDDEDNLQKTPEYWIALFESSKQSLMERLADFNRRGVESHGHYVARPFLLIGQQIYDGENGAFLYGQLNLIAYEEWNVLFLAGDVATKRTSGLPGHPGRLEAIEQVAQKKVVEWRKRHDFALETWGITATGGKGISREDYLREANIIRGEILDWAAWVKPRICEELLRVQGND